MNRGKLFKQAEPLLNSWARLPDVVGLGAQKNFVRFAEAIAPQWDASEVTFNERWFREAVGKAILFAATERIVSRQTWYQSGYRANIVTYTIALLSHCVEVVHRKVFDFEQIWRLQAFPMNLEAIIEDLAKAAFNVIVSPPSGYSNVTEWCKKEECWKRIKANEVRLRREIAPYLLDRGEDAGKKMEAKKGQVLDNKLSRLAYIMDKGQEYWANAIEWDASRKLLSEKQKSIVSQLARKRGFVPSDLQALVVIEAEKLLREEGFN